MNNQKRQLIQKTLHSLVDSYAVTMEVLQQTLSLLCEELPIDPLAFFRARFRAKAAPSGDRSPLTDPALFTVRFHGKACFLGNTLPFKLISRLAKRPFSYVTYEDLLAEVWEGRRSDSAVRSVVKVLRKKLRKAGLHEIADAIDGSVAGHYALRIST
jgi:hypothetical protein